MKKSFSKILSAVLVLILIASLCGCTQPVEEEPNNPNIPDDPTPGIVTRYDTLEEYLAQTIEDEVWVKFDFIGSDVPKTFSSNSKASEYTISTHDSVMHNGDDVFPPFVAEFSDGSKQELQFRSIPAIIYGDYLYAILNARTRHTDSELNLCWYFRLVELNINTGHIKTLDQTDIIMKFDDFSTRKRDILEGTINNLWVSSHTLVYHCNGALKLCLNSTGEIAEIWQARKNCYVVAIRPLSSNEFLFAVESVEFKQYLFEKQVPPTGDSLPFAGPTNPPALDYYVYNGQLDKTYFLGQASIIGGQSLVDLRDPKIPELLEQYYTQRDKDIAAIE